MTAFQKPFFLIYCSKCEESLAVGDDRKLTIDGEPWMHHNPLTFCPTCRTKLQKVWNTDNDFDKANLGYHNAYKKDSKVASVPRYKDVLAEKVIIDKKPKAAAAAKKKAVTNGDVTHGRQKTGRISA